jgi:hypothetical protein
VASDAQACPSATACYASSTPAAASAETTAATGEVDSRNLMRLVRSTPNSIIHHADQRIQTFIRMLLRFPEFRYLHG